MAFGSRTTCSRASAWAWTWGVAEGSPQVAIDAHGAGLHQRVVISSDGSAARNVVGDEKSPVRWVVIGVVDD